VTVRIPNGASTAGSDEGKTEVAAEAEADGARVQPTA